MGKTAREGPRLLGALKTITSFKASCSARRAGGGRRRAALLSTMVSIAPDGARQLAVGSPTCGATPMTARCGPRPQPAPRYDQPHPSRTASSTLSRCRHPIDRCHALTSSAALHGRPARVGVGRVRIGGDRRRPRRTNRRCPCRPGRGSTGVDDSSRRDPTATSDQTLATYWEVPGSVFP